MCRPCPKDGCDCILCLDWAGHGIDAEGHVVVEVEP